MSDCLVAYPKEMSPALAEVLGMPPHRLYPVWQLMRGVGFDIAHRYEAEVAAALHFLIPLAIRHEDWRSAADDELGRIRHAIRRPATRYSADARYEGGVITVTAYASDDPGPMREFRPVVTIELDEAHATELLGTLMIALDTPRAE
ncbi:hypothetical protein [Sphingomonas profundi]|uniref:hypothetical protein n=1 Tax=Alterirhizorhabdus profundi TaxID=2681549 RepID=UPI0012E70526|nr:hypothetical protein [Sphingomonas profundi]